jgi:tetratricopeptide (TPR) repeat protein
MTTESKTPKPEEVARKALLHKERGNSYYVRHQFSQALDWYTKAVEMNPEAYDGKIISFLSFFPLFSF